MPCIYVFWEKIHIFAGISLQAFLLHTRKKFSYINFKDLSFKDKNYPLTVAENYQLLLIKSKVACESRLALCLYTPKSSPSDCKTQRIRTFLQQKRWRVSQVMIAVSSSLHNFAAENLRYGMRSMPDKQQ